jgi:hypothetical protein
LPHDDVEELFHTGTGHRIGETDGHDVCLIHRPLERLVKGFVVGFLAFEIAFHQRIVDLDDLVQQLRVEPRYRAEIALSLTIQQAVDDSLAAIGGKVDRKAATSERLLELREKAFEEPDVAVNLVGHDGDGQVEVVRELHHAPAHAVDAGLRIHDDHHGLGGGQTSNGLADQVGCTGQVEQVDSLSEVPRVQERGIHGVVMLPLLLLEITRAGARFHGSFAARLTGPEQQGFGEGGLAAGSRTGEEDVVDVGSPVCGHFASLDRNSDRTSTKKPDRRASAMLPVQTPMRRWS